MSDSLSTHLMRWLTPPGDARQALRMRRFLTGLAGSLLVLLALFYCVLTGLLGRDTGVFAAVLVAGGNLLFFAVFRTGLNLRFADPSLTAYQLVASSATLLYVAYHAGPARPAFLFAVLTVFLFGVFRLRTRQLLVIALFDILIYAVSIVWPLGGHAAAGGGPADLRLEVLLLLMMAVSLTGFSLLAGQIVALRSNVEARNRELADAVRSLQQRQRELSELQQLVKLGTWSRNLGAGGEGSGGEGAVWSDVMFELYGLTPGQPVPPRQMIRQFVHPQDREQFDRHVDETGRSDNGGEIELRIMPRGGGLRWVRVQSHNLRGSDGTLQRQYGTMLDISAAKQGEQRLLMQHAVTKVLSEAASLGAAMPDILRTIAASQNWVAAACWRGMEDGLQLRCVDAWELDELPLKAFSAHQHATRIALSENRAGLLLTAWRTHRPAWIEDVAQMPGFGRHEAAAAANLHGVFVLPVVAGGAVLRLLEFYSHDARSPDALLLELAQSLGNQIGQFIERRSAEAALTTAREHLDLAVKASGIGFWDFAVATGQTHFSVHVSEMLGYDAASMPADQADQADFTGMVHPDERAALRAAHAAGIAHGKPYAMELRLRMANGGWHWFRGRAQAFYDAEGRAVRVAGSLTDIEDRKRIDRAKDEFVATVSHELRTPLTAIRGALGLLDGGVAGQLPDDANELVRVALSGSERLSRLVNDVLNLAKIEAGATALMAGAVDLDALVAEAVSANQIYCSGVGVTLRQGGGTRGAQLYADPDRLIQVLTNLISNAAKFSPAGSEVSVISVRSGARLRVNVIDHGSGIPASFHDRIFQKFAQVDGSDARAQQGSGLGLSICHALVTQMGGVIDFAGTPGGGTTFFVEFPEYDVDRTQENRAFIPLKITAGAAVPQAAAVTATQTPYTPP